MGITKRSNAWLRENFPSLDARIRYIASGSKYSGGSYPVLEIYTTKLPKIVAGNPECTKYVFFVPESDVQDNLLIAAADEQLRRKTRLLLQNVSHILFPDKYSHILIQDRFDVFVKWPFIRKVTVLQYVRLPHEIRENPSIMNDYVKIIAEFDKNLRMAGASSGQDDLVKNI